MTKNIKEIGKELLGKSLNSFHRKTGLTQLERNNKMQDGILNGILSQVDDAYIEKTEQSNVIYLDGSGDGVVVLDNIEGNTMVNLLPSDFIKSVQSNNENFIITSTWLQLGLWHKTPIKANATYTLIVDIIEKPSNVSIHQQNNSAYIGISTSSTSNLSLGRNIITITTSQCDRVDNMGHNYLGFLCQGFEEGQRVVISKNMILVEGNQVDKALNYFEGIQSSFEEKVNDEGKYEIEILSHKGRPNELKNSFKELQASPREYMSISITDIAKKYLGKRLVVSGKVKSIGKNGDVRIYSLGKYSVGFSTLFNCNTSNYINFVCEGRFTYESNGANGEACNLSFYGIYDSGIFPCVKDIKIEILDDNDNILATEWCPSYKDDEIHWKNHKNSNKIKLLINEPLRAVGDTKDRLCVKDGKLTIERNTFLQVLNGQEIWNMSDSLNTSNTTRYYTNTLTIPMILNSSGISDKIPYITGGGMDNMTCIYVHSTMNRIDIRRLNSDNRWTTLEELKVWLRNNNITLVLKRLEPYYEEILNEYGEPILLEGYENGTIYIDSTIVPTTTVRYTPKMESFKTLKEVENNNIMLTNDVNDNIIPYMMDVDLMIMEKEMALMSHKNIRKMEVLDMTSMQKRTQDMLERLIKGKTLTEQECKTRVTTYLHAGKITDEQAEELMLLIDEVYA